MNDNVQSSERISSISFSENPIKNATSLKGSDKSSETLGSHFFSCFLFKSKTIERTIKKSSINVLTKKTHKTSDQTKKKNPIFTSPSKNSEVTSSTAINNDPIKALKKLGYQTLLQRLERIPLEQRNQILNIENPLFIEQLTHLHELLHIKKDHLGEALVRSLFQFALDQTKTVTPGTSSLLGQLICVIDFDLINKMDKGNLREEIKKYYEKKIQETIREYDSMKAQFKVTSIYDPNIVARNQLSNILSRLLISSVGQINFGMIRSLTKTKLLERACPETYKNQLIHTLQSFRKSLKLRERLGSIETPPSEQAISNVVIRASLGIPSYQSVTELHSKRVVFSALTSHFRQGSDGSCFATPLAIVFLNSQLEQCLDDFASLIQGGKLTRKLNHVTQDFPFILKVSNGTLEKTLTLDESISESPEVIAACQALGINDPKTAIKQISPKNPKTFTVKGFLQNLVLYAKENVPHPSMGIGPLFLRASFAFESQMSNSLLQVWENAIAGMAEPDETGMVRSAIVSAVMETLHDKIHRIDPSASLELEKQIKKELSKRIHLQYDPMIPFDDKCEDNISTEGAFVLYDKNHQDDPSRWKRIDHPKLFAELIKKTLRSTKRSKKKHKHLISKLLRFASTQHFLTSCLVNYYERNEDVKNPLKNYKSLKYAPWITKSGNDFSKVIQVYLENFMASNSEIHTPKGTKDLLKIIASIGSTLRTEETSNIIPIRIQGVHAFNLILSHPSLSKLWENQEGLSQWIDSEILLPGKQLAETPIDNDTINSFIEAASNQIIPDQKRQEFKELCNKKPKTLTIKELRSFIHSNSRQLINDQTLLSSELSNQLDMLLFQSLPHEIMRKVQESALQFADTNWSEGLHDLHLCFLVNPGTGNLEVFATYEDRSKFFPINADQWITGKKWEFFTDTQKYIAK